MQEGRRTYVTYEYPILNPYTGQPLELCGFPDCKKIKEATSTRSKYDWCQYHRKTWERFKRMGVSEERFMILATTEHCEICGTPGKMGESPNLYVDHEHGYCPEHTKEQYCNACIRGMLCPSCNTLLAALDKPGYINKAQKYLADRDYVKTQLEL